MSLLGVVINICIYFAKLPEVRQVVTDSAQAKISSAGFWKQYHLLFGFRESVEIMARRFIVTAADPFFLFSWHPSCRMVLRRCSGRSRQFRRLLHRRTTWNRPSLLSSLGLKHVFRMSSRLYCRTFHWSFVPQVL